MHEDPMDVKLSSCKPGDHPNRLLRLPMVPEARSLNLSNCVAVVAYEILRQQKFIGLSTSEAIKGEDFLDKEANKK